MVPTGKFKEVVGGSLVMTSNSGGRICHDTVQEVLEKIKDSENEFST
jgi:hypothetical protein